MAKMPTPVSLFVVKVPDIDTIGMFTQCSGLEMKVDVLEYAEGGNNEFVHQLPGQVSYPNLILERGLTNDDAVLKWFNATRTQAAAQRGDDHLSDAHAAADPDVHVRRRIPGAVERPVVAGGCVDASRWRRSRSRTAA